MSPRILIAIPYYNHPDTLRKVVKKSLAQQKDVIVIDDGSQVSATSLIHDLGVHVERHPVNRGKGEAILTAGRYAKGHDFTHLVTLDADDQHEPGDFAKFKAAIETDASAMYVGCRDFTADNVPNSSKFGREFSNFWFRLQTGQSLKDCQSGYRAYPVPLLTEINYMFRTYAFEVEVLVRAAWAGLACKDIDIAVYYPPRDERISHFNKFRDNFRLSLLNTHLTGRSVTPWPHQKLSISPEKKMEKEKITIFHPFRSLKRLVAEHTTPGQLALAAALGVFVGTLPIFFFHTVIIIFASTFFRANKPAAISASQLCMPPFVPAFCIELGHFMRTGTFLTEISLNTLGYQAIDRLWEWFLGSLILGPALAALVGAIVYLLSINIQRSLRGSESKAAGSAVDQP